MNWDLEHCPGLLLTNGNRAVAYMLAPHPNYIAPPLCRVQQQRKSEAGFRANRMPGLILSDLGFSPSMNAVRFYAGRLYSLRRIIGAEILGNRELKQRSQCL